MPWLNVASRGFRVSDEGHRVTTFELFFGLVFVFARPNRYLVNPVFGLKFSLLAPAVVLSSIQQRLNAGAERFSDHPATRRTLIRVLAACSLALWLGVVMAGRWIAYSDYIFPPE